MSVPDRERIEAWLLGSLSPAEAEALQASLVDPATAEAVIDIAGEFVALRTALAESAPLAASPPRPTSQQRRMHRSSEPDGPSRRRNRWLGVGLIAAAVLLMAFWWLHDEEAGETPGERLSSPVVAGQWRLVEESDATGPPSGDPLAPGSILTTDVAVGTHLRQHAPPVDLHLHGPYHLEIIDADSLRLDQGRLEASVAERDGQRPFSITTPQARCTVYGTRFIVHVSAMTTRLEVTEGSVGFRARLASGDLGPERLVTAGLVARSDRGPEDAPLIAYRMDEGAAGLTGVGRLENILPLRMQREAAWTGDGLLFDTEHHCVTPANAPWPELREALIASRAITISARVRSVQPPPANVLLCSLYIRMPERGQRRLLQLWMWGGAANTWERWSITVSPDGAVHTYRNGQLERHSIMEEWPPQPSDPSIQIKLFQPVGDHGEPDPDLQLEYADLLVFDRALTASELRQIDAGATVE